MPASTMIKALVYCVVFCFFGFRISGAEAAKSAMNFPYALNLPSGELMIYQPQPETLDGDILTARAAVSYLPRGQNEAVFGAAWFTIALDCDRDERLATVRYAEINALRFPQENKFDTAAIKAEFNQNPIAHTSLTISLDLLTAALKAEAASTPELDNNPPQIFIREHPAVLVVIDGEPHFAPLENSAVLAIVNSPYSIFLDSATKKYYLAGGEKWFVADALTPSAKWTFVESPPAEILAVATANTVPMPTEKMATTPEIIVSTQPAELLCTDGKPEFKAVVETDLLCIANSDRDIFYEPATQLYYVLLAGRWFTNAGFNETGWQFIAADKVPPVFAKISPSSATGGVLAAIAGTQAAEEAVMDAQIPQTSKIMLNETPKVEVAYDGEPQFVPVKNTQLQYAVNASQPVILYAQNYYCCADGVWYLSKSHAHGWEVCRVVPAEIYRLPPDNPYYYTRYVYVYEATPTYVVVGYTSGYLGSYYCGGVMVWGTGFYYRPWYRHYYYPRPATFGFRVAYNPHTGNWAFAAGWRAPRAGGGFFAVNFNNRVYHNGGYWGPGHYRDVNINFNHKVTVNNFYNTNVYQRRHQPALTRQDIQPRLQPLTTARNEPRGAAGAREPSVTPNRHLPPVSGHATGEVITDRSGNVFRRDGNNQWQENRSGNRWENTATERVTARRENTPSSAEGHNSPTANNRQPLIGGERPTISAPHTSPASENRTRPAREATTRGFSRNNSAAEVARTQERARQRTDNFHSSRSQSPSSGERGGRKR